MRSNSGREAGGDSVALMITSPRPNADLRSAQVAIADSVNNDPRLLNDWERHADLTELLDAFGLYRRIC